MPANLAVKAQMYSEFERSESFGVGNHMPFNDNYLPSKSVPSKFLQGGKTKILARKIDAGH